MSDIQTISGESPFDAIRRVRADGSEYWSARDLMPLMGYGTWERFKNPIERALASARNQLGDRNCTWVQPLNAVGAPGLSDTTHTSPSSRTAVTLCS